MKAHMEITYLSQMMRAWMNQDRISFTELSSRIGINRSTLHRFVHGKQINSNDLNKIIVWTFCTTFI